MLQAVNDGFIMDSRYRRGPTTHSSDSSTGEPVPVRRRIDLEGNFAATRQRRTARGHKCTRPEETGAYDRYCDESLLQVALTPQQDLHMEVETRGLGYSKGILPENGNTSNIDSDLSDTETEQKWQTDDDQSRTSSSRVVGNGQQDTDVFVVSESTEICSGSERSNTSGKDTWERNKTEVLQYSDSDTESAIEAHDWSSDFGGSSFSLMALDVSCEKAAESLQQEKERQEYVLSVISRHLTKVSLLTCEFYRVVKEPIDKFVTNNADQGSERWRVFGEPDSSVPFEQRFEAVKAYVLDVCTVAAKQAEAEDCKQPVGQVRRRPAVSHSAKQIDTTSSEDDIRKGVPVGNVRYNHILRKASNSVRKSRNVVVRQRKKIYKLCAVAEKVVSKAEISCQVILDCLKTIVNVLEPAVGTSWIMEQAVRKLEKQGKGLAKFSDAASVAAQWTREGLSDAEDAVRLHREASRALHAARGDLDAMRGYQPHGAAAACRVADAGDRFLELALQPSASLAEVERLESDMKLMRGSLVPLLDDMRNFRVLIEEWSDMCSDTVSVILQALSLATQSSCNAIEATLRGLFQLACDCRKE